MSQAATTKELSESLTELLSYTIETVSIAVSSRYNNMRMHRDANGFISISSDADPQYGWRFLSAQEHIELAEDASWIDTNSN
jgi:hypothetical protein